jgi:hypothetical protein
MSISTKTLPIFLEGLVKDEETREMNCPKAFPMPLKAPPF